MDTDLSKVPDLNASGRKYLFFSRFRIFNKHIGLRSKITIPYLFLATVIILAGAYVITQIVFDTIADRYTNQLVEAAKLATERMVVEENRLLATLRLLANTQGVPEAIQTNNPERLRELVFGSIVNNQEEAVEFLDLTGKNILSLHHKTGGNIEEYSFSTGGTDTSHWDIVQQVLNNKNDELGDKFSAAIKTDRGDYFYIAGPIYDVERNLQGVVLVGSSAQSLAKKFREETLAQITLYDLEGEPIASTLQVTVELGDEFAQTILTGQDSRTYRRLLNQQPILAEFGYEEILGPWEGRGDMDLGILGVAISKSFIVNTTNLTRLQIAILAGLTFLFVILVGWSLANAITRPIYKLVNASRQVSKGNLNFQIADSSQDELAILVESFNDMVNNLDNSRKALLDSYDYTLEGWSKALGLRDKETKEHTTRVTDLTLMIATELGIPKNRLDHMRRGAILHDIGKMGVPDSILLKPGKLNDEEWENIKQHPTYAYEMLKDIDFLKPALAIPYCHHENWDGSGYPRGLKGEEIPIEARIFALVDTWDALTSDRPYRKALPNQAAIAIIKSETGTRFDPDITELFLRIIPE